MISPVSEQESMSSRIKTYDTYIRTTIDSESVNNPEALSADQREIVKLVCNGLDSEQKIDLSWLLHERLCNILEHEEAKSWKITQETLKSHLCLYLTREWIHVVAFSRKLGYVKISFGNPAKSGFAARLKHIDRKLVWSDEYETLTQDEHINPIQNDHLYNHIYNASAGIQHSSEMTKELFQQVKQFVEKKMEEKFTSVMVVISTQFRFEQRAFLRECCKTIGFRRSVILSDSSLSAYRVFQTTPPLVFVNIDNRISVVVVNIGKLYMARLEVYAQVNQGDMKGVKLLAVAYSDLKLESVKRAYKRIMDEIPRRNLIRYYVILAEDNTILADNVDEYLRKEGKLTKAEGIDGNNLWEIFSHFSNNPVRLSKFLEVLTDSSVNEGKDIEDDGRDNNEVLDRKQDLLKTCRIMEQQIAEGSMRLGVLSKRIIKDAIKQARLAVSEDFLGGKEETEVYELFKSFNFKHGDNQDKQTSRPHSSIDESLEEISQEVVNDKVEQANASLDTDIKNNHINIDIKNIPSDIYLNISSSEIDINIAPSDSDIIDAAIDIEINNVPSDTDIIDAPLDTDTIDAPLDSEINNAPSDIAIIDAPLDTEIKNASSDVAIIDAPSDTAINNPPSDSGINNASSDSDINSPPSDTDLNNATSETDINNAPSDTDIIDAPLDTDIEDASSDTNINSPPSDTNYIMATNVAKLTALGYAKLPLKFRTLDGKVYQILAYTNWTVGRLRKEFQDCRGHTDEEFELQYKSQALNEDDTLLSIFKIEPDSVIEANVGKVAGPIHLIGNCVALKNGTEPEEVDGIKSGSLISARTNEEVNTRGVVGLTCKINGYNDTVYVGVKFKKQLALGSSGIQIEHVDFGEGYCEKCKGRRSLFIPSDKIGYSKEYLFQVQ